MSKPNRAVVAWIISSSLLFGAAANGATYHVATTGNNGNPGTEKQPWRTIAYAVATMVAGDTTFVKSGTYMETSIRFGRSGTQSAPIKLLNYPGEYPIIDCGKTAATVTPGDMILIRNSAGSNRPIGWITIEGFEIRRCYKAIKWYNLHDSVIRRNWLHDSLKGSSILAIGGTRVLIDRNRINNNATFTPEGVAYGGHGVYLHGSAYTLTNNLFYDNHTFGIQMNGSATSIYDPAKHPSPEFAGAANWIIANNTLAYNKNGAGIVVWGSLCNNARIENNILYENASERSSSYTQGVTFTSASCTGIQIRNNHFYASGSGGTVAIGPGATEKVHYAQSGNIINVSAPAFVNGGNNALPASPNFRLTAKSPAIDKGLNPNLPSAKVDFAGGLRPEGKPYDIGAYEYDSTVTDTLKPGPPTGLEVK